MTANPVHVGRILEHAGDWCWLRLDHAATALQPGDRIRVRPVNEDAPFRNGECRVLGTFDDFVHVERAAYWDIAAIADMDHVYLTERRRPYAPGEKMTDRHPDSAIAQCIEQSTADVSEFLPPAPVSPELLEQRDRLVRETREAMGMPADMFRGVDRSATPEKLSGAVLAAGRRPDGFDQHQVDAAKAALLAPAPPRYPRRTR